MNPSLFNYSLYYKFIETFSLTGYVNISRVHPLILELEEMTKALNQYFFIADLFQGKILYTSQRSFDMLGIPPDELNPYHNIEACHPEEVHRNTKGWSKLLEMGNQLLQMQSGQQLFSTNMRVRNPKGIYSDTLFQCLLHYSGFNNHKVYDLQVHTCIDTFIRHKQDYHHYAGDDLKNFRYPDTALLAIGIPYSEREFEIIRLIEMGCSSATIAGKLFISLNTVNTHRRNIIAKSGKSNFTELLHDLQVKRLL